MQKIILTLLTIMLLLILTGLAATNQNPKPFPLNESELAGDVAKESSQSIERNTQAAQTSTQPDDSGDQTLTSDAEKTAEPNQNLGYQNPAEGGDPKKENIQTLENSAQNQNSNDNDFTPPNGRIYYPTSSGEIYAYTPTYTPKEKSMPIIPTIPQD